MAENSKKKKMIFSPITPETTFQYADLNIKHTDPEKTLAMVKRAVRMGYDSVAINIDVGDISDYYTESDILWTPATKITGEEAPEEPPKKKKKKGGAAQNDGKLADGLAGVLRKKLLPIPFYVNVDELDTEDLEKRGKVFRQFSRITFTANEQIVLNKTFIHPTVLSYDLVAVRPGEQSVLETLSRKTELFDIITIDRLESEKAKWLTQSKVLERMRGDGIYYELSYSESLISASRRQALFNGRVLLRSLKTKNIILSSGSEEMIDLRAPVDVMNMSILWGIANNEARKLVSGNPKNLLLQAESRGTENGDVHSMKLADAENMHIEDEDDEDNTKEKSKIEKPAIEVRMTNIQYEQLLKVTKEAHEAAKKIRENQAKS